MDSSKLMSNQSKSNAKISWCSGPSIKQTFIFSSPIIYYMAKNPISPKIYLKLAKSCKYFFEKNPILVVTRIYDGGRIFCLCKNIGECLRKNGKCCVTVDIEKIKSKIWLTYEIEFSKNAISKIATILIPKLYRCDNAQLKLWYITKTFDDMELWGTKFQKFVIYGGEILDDDDGSNVMLERYIESIPDVKEFFYWANNENSFITSSTLKNLLKLKNLQNLRVFTLYKVPEYVAAEDIKNLIKTFKDTKFRFHYWSISEAYETQLNTLIDEIIDSEICNCIIFHYGQNQDKLKIMRNRYNF